MVAVASLRDQLHPAVIASPGPVHDLTEDPRQQLTHAGRVGHWSTLLLTEAGMVLVVRDR
jgi:hypothetical protein